MSFSEKYLATAKTLITGYTPPLPFHHYLKKYFTANKKHGSRDRKIISALCYGYFRLGKNFSKETTEAKLLAGLLLCHPELAGNDWQELTARYFPFAGEDFVSASLEEKTSAFTTHSGFDRGLLFPFQGKLSPLNDVDSFLTSHLHRPLVWLRARQGKLAKAEEALTAAGVAFEKHPPVPNALGLPQQTNVEQVLGNRYYHTAEIQDASSQLTGNYIALNPSEKVWDCCCGAGGKSLMLKDKEQKIELYCSDIRPQILQNLEERFKLSGLARPFTGTIDLSAGKNDVLKFENKSEYKTVKGGYFDTIIADVPCTGSGTWARTPEQGFYFEEKQIEEYAAKQRGLITPALPFLKPGGRLYYITCSVFSAENEGHFSFFESLGLTVKEHHLIEGWRYNADSMFIAVLEKNSKS